MTEEQLERAVERILTALEHHTKGDACQQEKDRIKELEAERDTWHAHWELTADALVKRGRTIEERDEKITELSERLHSLELHRDRAREELETLEQVNDALRSQVDRLNHQVAVRDNVVASSHPVIDHLHHRIKELEYENSLLIEGMSWLEQKYEEHVRRNDEDATSLV